MLKSPLTSVLNANFLMFCHPGHPWSCESSGVGKIGALSDTVKRWHSYGHIICPYVVILLLVLFQGIRTTSATNFLQTAPIYWVSNPLTLQFCKTKKRHKMGWMFLRIQIWFLCTNTFSVFKSYFSVLILFDLWYKMNRYQPNIHIGKVSTTSKKSKPFYKGFVFIARVFLT